MKKDWFMGCETLQEVKERFKDLAFKLFDHESRSFIPPNDEKFRDVKNEYEWLVKELLKGPQVNNKHEEFFYTDKQQQTWWRMHFEWSDMIEKIVRIKDADIEITGIFIRVNPRLNPDTKKKEFSQVTKEYLSGKFEEYKDAKTGKKRWKCIQEGIGFKYSREKYQYFWHPESWVKHTKNTWSMDAIRGTFGSKKVDNEYSEENQLEG